MDKLTVRYVDRFSCNLIRFCSSKSSTLSDHERRQMLERIIRVDHAGEMGADRIYAGQISVLGRTSVGPVIKNMWEQEKEHLQIMERLIPKHQVKPTVLAPIWHVAGFVLGASSALIGKEGAMACTVAVEEVIGEHYNNQIRELMEDDPETHKELLEILTKLRDDELEHHDKGVEYNAKQAPMYDTLKLVIQSGCRAAIWLSERI